MTNFRIAVKSFIVDKNKLFILKRQPKEAHLPNIWEIPGGRLHPGEDPFEGLKRETKEETGVDVEILHPLTVRHFTRQDGQVITMIIFLCRPLSTSIKLSKEHTAYDWIDLTQDISKLSDFYHKEVEIFKKNFLTALIKTSSLLTKLIHQKFGVICPSPLINSDI